MHVTKQMVVTAIDKAEARYLHCFSFFNINVPSENQIKVNDFQHFLADTMLSIMRLYQSVCQEKDYLIGRKCTYKKSWFASRMATLDIYKKVLSETINIGKDLGDGFIWFFYKDNMDELEKNLNHKSVGLFTTGIGAEGEVEFIRNHEMLYGYFVLYHGITSILRIGDFSLYHPQHGVVGIGELKTVEENGHLVVSAYVTSKGPLFESDGSTTSVEFDYSSAKVINVDKFKQQMLVIEETLRRIEQEGQQAEIYSDDIQPILNRLVTKTESIEVDVENKLLVIGIPINTRKLSSTLFYNFVSNPNELGQKIVEALKYIMPEESEYNRICLGEIPHKTAFGETPLLWWNINAGVKKRLLFRNLHVTTIFNPVDIFKYFLSNGYHIEEKVGPDGSMGHVNCSKAFNGKKMTVANIEWMFDAVSHNLSTVKFVISVMEMFLAQADPDKIHQPTKINLRMVSRMFDRPTTLE